MDQADWSNWINVPQFVQDSSSSAGSLSHLPDDQLRCHLFLTGSRRYLLLGQDEEEKKRALRINDYSLRYCIRSFILLNN